MDVQDRLDGATIKVTAGKAAGLTGVRCCVVPVTECGAETCRAVVVLPPAHVHLVASDHLSL